MWSAESTVNNCHYESVTTKVRCHCIEKFKDVVFMYGLLGKLWILMGVLLPYLYKMQTHIFSIGQETMLTRFFN